MMRPVNRSPATISPLTAADLDVADDVMRQAFAERASMRPGEAFRDRSMLRARLKLHPGGAVVAHMDGEVAGSALSMRWGSVAVFGPLSVRPDLQNLGVGRALLAGALARMAEWDAEHTGLFTWSESPGHLALYRAAGFWPRFLSLLMAKPLAARHAGEVRTVSALPESEREAAVAACAEIAGAVRPGLDLSTEIRGLPELGFGDTVLLGADGDLEGFAVCHTGPGSEAGSGHCLAKFAAVRPGPGARERFGELIAACERYAAARGAFRIEAMIDAGRVGASRALLDRGFLVAFQGVNLHRDALEGYDGPDVWVADDWR
jgi:predicted N-acetyltransferase YhbS